MRVGSAGGCWLPLCDLLNACQLNTSAHQQHKSTLYFSLPHFKPNDLPELQINSDGSAPELYQSADVACESPSTSNNSIKTNNVLGNQENPVSVLSTGEATKKITELELSEEDAKIALDCVEKLGFFDVNQVFDAIELAGPPSAREARLTDDQLTAQHALLESMGIKGEVSPPPDEYACSIDSDSDTSTDDYKLQDNRNRNRKSKAMMNEIGTGVGVKR